jgi:AcrR family transcriptional regulator
MTSSYIAHLEDTFRSNPPAKKGMRTKEKIKISTARMLEEKGFHNLRVIDITLDAKIAEGSFYFYYKDKADATLDVLTGLLIEFFNMQGRVPGEHSAFAAIQAANRRWISVCRSNAGLMRCILQFSDEAPQFALLGQRSNRQWHEVVADSVLRRRGGDRGAVLLAIYVLGAMMDEIVRKLVIYPDQEFQRLLEELRADDDAVADAASVIWLRVLYPNERPDAALAPAAERLAGTLWPIGPGLGAA